MDHSTAPGLSQSQPGFVPFGGVALAGDVDENGDLVSALTLRLARAIDVESEEGAAQLERVRAVVLHARAGRAPEPGCLWAVPS